MPATVVNSVSVNTEGSLFAAALSTGLRVLNMEPLVVKRVLDRTVLGGGSVRLCALLHRTNLIALVGGNGNGSDFDQNPNNNIEEGCSKWSDRRVLVWDDALRRFVLEFTFASPVLALRTTRERLFVVERAQITAFTFPGHLGHPGPVRRLFTVETRDNGRGLCEVTPVTAAAAAALHLLVFPGHKCGSVQLVNHRSMNRDCLSTTAAAGANCLSSSTAPASLPSSQFGTKNGTTSTVNKVIAGDEPKLACKTDYSTNSSSTNGENKNGANQKDFLFDSDDGENKNDRQTNFWESDSLEVSEEEEEEEIDCDESGEKLDEDTAGDAENLKNHHHHQFPLSPITDANITSKSASVSFSPTTLSAHQTEVACLALNRRGTLLATASQKGTLIRVFRTSTTSSSSSEGVHSTSSSSEDNFASSSPYTAPLAPTLLTELRRGLDVATVYCIAFSADDAFLLASSDKGTVHIFALKEGRLNRRSSLYNVVGPCFSQHLTALAGVTGAAAYSLARFTLPAECACVATFGTSGSLGTSGPGSGSAGRRRSVYAVCVDGSYHKYVFSADGSSCEREVYDHYLDAPDEEETMFL